MPPGLEPRPAVTPNNVADVPIGALRRLGSVRRMDDATGAGVIPDSGEDDDAGETDLNASLGQPPASGGGALARLRADQLQGVMSSCLALSPISRAARVSRAR